MARELVIVAAGDISIGLEEFPPRDGLVPMRKDKAGVRAWLNKIAPVLREADFTFGNLEGLICEPMPDLEGRAIWGNIVRMPREVADILKDAGFDALSLANNHSMDLGSEGLLQTVANLDRVGIAHSGGGANIHQARAPAILEKHSVKVALLSYSSVFVPGTFPAGKDKPGIATVAVSTGYEISNRLSYSPGLLPRVVTTANQSDVKRMIEDVHQARARSDLVVVSWHWGVTRHANAGASGIAIEDTPLPVLDYQQEVGRAAIDAGADIVFGHHPFRLQGVEIYNSKPICYCLGRLSTGYTYLEPVFSEDSVLLKVYVDVNSKRINRVALVPIRIPDQTQEPYPVSGDCADVVRELEKQSKKYGTRFQSRAGEITVS